MLEFEHLVQVNDLGNKSIMPLTRSQLWQGLVLRAKSPQTFNHALKCTCKALGENEFLRTIVAGDARFQEHVVLHPQEVIQTNTVQDVEQIAAGSTARIEEPQPGYLFVRFSYRRELDDSDGRVNIEEHLKSAYVQIDRDAIAMIRLLAESDRFDKPVS